MPSDRGKDRHIKHEQRRLFQRKYQREYAWKKKFGLSKHPVRQGRITEHRPPLTGRSFLLGSRLVGGGTGKIPNPQNLNGSGAPCGPVSANRIGTGVRAYRPAEAA